MPKRVDELERFSKEEGNPLRSKLLNFLKNNHELAYTLNELYKHFLNEDKKTVKIYQKNPKVLYRLIYGYLWDFKINGLIEHKAKHYYFKRLKNEQ